jgi:Tfp pilus assembly protein PilF
MDATQLFREALARHRAGALVEAEQLYGRALALQPDNVSALVNRAAALRDLGRPAEALAALDRALALQPDHAFALNNKGVALIDLRRPAEAAGCFERAAQLKPDYAEALNNLGKALASLDPAPDPAVSLTAFDRAIALRPDYAEAWDNRGVLLAELGRLDEAAAAIEQAIRLQPRRVSPYYHLTLTRPLASGDPHIAAMQALAAQADALSLDDRIELDFALAAALDGAGDPEAAFARLAEGNALNRARIDYDEAATLGALTRTAELYTPQVMAAGAGAGGPTDLPVFIVGMPRSGTTLVEQILASHPAVFGAGESSAFPAAMTDEGVAFPEVAAGLGPAALQRLGERYLGRIRPLAPDALRITDKRPDNFRFAGLLHLALPGARIVHVRRAAADTCLSCFSKLFGPAVPYASDLGELGRYWRAYEALMAHWRKVIPPETLLEVDYEALVADPEAQARRLIAHCGLEWDPACLEFWRAPRRVRTASAAQVRAPVHGEAVGRWRAYQPWLGPLLEALGQEPARVKPAGKSGSRKRR